MSSAKIDISAPVLWRKSICSTTRRRHPWRDTSAARCSWKSRGASRRPYKALRHLHSLSGSVKGGLK
eukprot:11770310-Heterocapsa_arctica.AAC.1